MSLNHKNSKQAYEEARQYISGGVNSPVRAFTSVGETPVFYDHAKGAYITDIDGNTYVDFIGSWGPMILGQAKEEVLDAVRDALDKGTSFGAPSVTETRLAKLICEIIPSADLVRFVSSGTEATMTAIRLARGYTNREKFIKFEGNYHGHSDALLAAAGSGVATLNIPGTPGVTEGAVKDTLLAEYNNLESVKALFDKNPDEIACIIVEPVAGNMGVVPPKEGFLEGLRNLCNEYGALLIFDEVITGFRASLQGAQTRFGVTPDLTTFGKIIGGGFPVGAVCGKREIMEYLSPTGPVYQAGTLSGNPIAMTAGYTMLSLLQKDPEVYTRLDTLGDQLEQGLNAIIEELNLDACVNRVGSTLTLFFTSGPVENYEDAQKSDTDAFAHWFSGMLDRGYMIAPSQFEALFLSDAMDSSIIEAFLKDAREVLEEM